MLVTPLGAQNSVVLVLLLLLLFFFFPPRPLSNRAGGSGRGWG